MSVKRNKSGFTIVELMVGMLASALLAVVVGTMLVYGWLGWRNYSETVNMHRDGMIAMRIMAKEIRNSNISEISGDGDSIDFTAGVVRGSALVFSASEIPFSPGVVLQSWTPPVINADSVTVTFSLRNSRGTDVNEYVMTIYPRN